MPVGQQLWGRGEQGQTHAVQLEEGHDGQLVGQQHRGGVAGQVSVFIVSRIHLADRA